MENVKIIRKNINKWKLVNAVQDFYQSSFITLCGDMLVDTETGEVHPEKIRWTGSQYELYKPYERKEFL